ncbi:MAG: polysaccharide biosynthesis/export family protein [Pseudomonadota bacterium]
MPFRLTSLLLFLALILVASCSSVGSSNSSISDQPLSLPDTTTVTHSGDLRIGSLDLINIRVFGVEELGGDFQVDHEGAVKLPLVGTVNAKGYTSLEFAQLLERRLGETYLQNPDVTVTIEESLGRQVTIEGSVREPGVYDVDGTITLLQAVALGGGTSDDANPGRVIVFRQVQGERLAAGFNLTDIRRGEAEDPPIYGNDIVVVDGSQARQTYGELLRSVPLLALFILY